MSSPSGAKAASLRWTMGLFMACFVLAQADKQVMGLLAVPVQKALQLSDTQLGLLQGLAFSLTYAVAGLPIARLLDQGHRVRIAAACVLIWSLATLACGLAGSFAVLVLFRAATAFAEAGLAPAALSVLSQSADRRTIARTTGIFMSAPYIGGGFALVGGGLALKLLTDSGLSFPGWDAPWRMVLLLIGVLGIAMAALLAVGAREPARPTSGTGDVSPLPSLREILSVIFVRTPFLRFYYLALTTFSLFLYANVSWYTVLLIRRYALVPSIAGAYSGSVYLLAGVAGTLFASAVSAFRRDDSVRGLIAGFVVVAAILLPAGCALPLVQTLRASLVLYGVFAFLSAMIVSLMVVPIQLSVSSRMQARSIALCVFATSAISGSAGPLAVGLLIDRAGLQLGGALAVTSLVSLGLTVVLLALSWRTCRTDGLDRAVPRAEA